MRLTAETLDDLCRKVFPALMKGASAITPTRGPARERYGVLLELRNPRARLSRTETRGKPFSCLGELLWYLSRDNRLDFISYYIKKYEQESEDGETVYGGYGPRLFKMRGSDQVAAVIEALKSRRETRKAVVQVFDADDISLSGNPHPEVPCTCVLQFLRRGERLHLMTTMRSNDAYMGLPHDVFCFTMLQEIVARSVGVEVGEYKQFVGSLHLYDDDRDKAEQYLAEGVQATVAMPAMPIGDPWPALQTLLLAEGQIRLGEPLTPLVKKLDPYWADLVRLLTVFKASGDSVQIQKLKRKISFKGYNVYIDGRKMMNPPTVRPARQLQFLM